MTELELPAVWSEARAVVADRLEARLEDRILAVQWEHEQAWEHLGPAARDWLRETLNGLLRDVRADVLALVRDLP